jgi:hypothetical protein
MQMLGKVYNPGDTGTTTGKVGMTNGKRRRIIGEILDFYDKWKGVSQTINQSLRTKRNREAWGLIKKIVIETNIEVEK